LNQLFVGNIILYSYFY